MADIHSIKTSSDLNYSAAKMSQNQISFHGFKEGTISQPKQKAKIMIDLRFPRLVHIFSSESLPDVSNMLNGEDSKRIPELDASLPSTGRSVRQQTAKRGGRFSKCYSRKGTTHSSGGVISATHDSLTQCSGRGSSPVSRNLYDLHGESNTLLVGMSDIIDGNMFGHLEMPASDISNLSERNDSNVTADSKSSQPSTIIHLKLVSPTDKQEQSHNIEENTGECNFNTVHTDNKAKKRKKEMPVEGTSVDSTSDSEDDLPLTVHRKRRNEALELDAGGDGDSQNLTERVQRTYQRVSARQHASSSGMIITVDSQKRKNLQHFYENSASTGKPRKAKLDEKSSDMTGQFGSKFVISSEQEKLGKSRRSQIPSSSDLRKRQQMILEEYERNYQLLRNTPGSGRVVENRKVKLLNKNSRESETPRSESFKRSSLQAKKPLSNKKSSRLSCLKPGPMSFKRKEMKQLGINARMISKVLRELTERRIPSGWTQVSLHCNSHQNYYDGCLVVRLMKCLPPKEIISIRVPVECRDDLDQVGKEALLLWMLTDDDVSELQKQVKQEMKHKRTEHIMPVVLQMSYEQIETAYAQVKKDMKTYEITENDSDEEPEDDEQDAGVEDVDYEEDIKGGLENEIDESLHETSYNIIVHDETSKMVSRETVKYLGWKKQHPESENGLSEMQGVSKQEVKHKRSGLIIRQDEVENTETLGDSRQTNYCRSRPKRHAVDYSPNAFAPIRLMEGKRLSGTPLKNQVKKPAGKRVQCPRSSRRSEENSLNCSTADNTSEIDEGLVQHEIPKEISAEVDCAQENDSEKLHAVCSNANHTEQDCQHSEELTSSNMTLSVYTDEIPPASPLTDERTAAADDVPVILDASDVLIYPSTESPFSVEQPELFSKIDSSTVDISAEEQSINKCSLIPSGMVDKSLQSNDQVLKPNKNSDGMENMQRCNTDQRQLSQNSLLKTGDGLSAKEMIQNEAYELILLQETEQDSLSIMPSLQLQNTNVHKMETEEPMVPPDLGQPVECVGLLDSGFPLQPSLVLPLEGDDEKVIKGSSVSCSSLCAGEVSNNGSNDAAFELSATVDNH